MADRSRNIPGMIASAAAMGFIVGLYTVLAVALSSPESGITQGTLVALLIPLAAAAIGAIVGVTLTRTATASAPRRSDWGQPHAA